MLLGVVIAGVPITGLASKVVTLEGHEGEISSLAFSPDGRWLASGAAGIPDHGVRLWEVATGKSFAAYNPDVRGAAWSLAFSPDAKLLFVGDLGLSLRVLAVPSVGEKAAWPTSPDRGFVANLVAVAPDGKTVAAGLSDGTILLYAAGSGQVVRKLSQDMAITALAFAPDGKTLAAGTSLGVRLWEVLAGKPVFALEKNGTGQFEVQSLAFTPDGKTLITADSPGFVRFLNTADGKELRAFSMPRVGDATTVDALVLSPDGKRAYCSGRLSKPKGVSLFEGIVALDPATAKPLGVAMPGDSWGEHVTKLAISPDGKRLAVAVNGSRTIRLIETSTVVTLDKLPTKE